MPGRHSPSKLIERRLRAVRRGFAQLRPSSTRFIEVGAEIAGRAKAAVKSLAVHNELNKQ